MKPNVLRGAVVELFRQGKSMSVIAKTLTMARSTVSDTVKRFQELGTLDDRVGRGKKRTVRTRDNQTKNKAKFYHFHPKVG